MIHEQQTLTAAVVAAPRWMSEEEARHRYQIYVRSYLNVSFYPAHFIEWLDLMRVKIL